MENNLYEPIMRKVNAWIDYDKNKPKCPYEDNPQLHDDYRSKNDLDCILTGGNLKADTIFSLWLPLRFALVRINGYDKLNKFGNINDKITFVKAISSYEVLKELLPVSNVTVQKLLRLFELGQERCNVMILKDRQMQFKDNYDYMPSFLFECFDNGKFSCFFEKDNKILLKWIYEENLKMFFNGDISKETIKDLAGTGNIKKNIPEDLDFMFNNYIEILEQRKKLIN